MTDSKTADQLTNICHQTMPQTSTLSKESIIFGGIEQNVTNPKDKYEAIVHSLFKFEQNSHDLSHLLGGSGVIPSDLSQCKLLIKILFEQLWNARKVCDEQQQFIAYMNQIDAGNRMQLSFILKELKERHLPIYMKCYEKLQANESWQHWKKMRLNDQKIKELKQNIERIKENHQALNRKMEGNCAQNVQSMQMQTIYNLKNEQAAAIQKFDLKLNEQINSNQDESDDDEGNNNLFGRSKIDLSQALKSVDSINISSINIKAPRPEYVDLIKDNKEGEDEDEDEGDEDDDDDDEDGDEDEDDDEWIDSIKKFLSDINRKIPRLDLSEIVERLDSLRYCSEFDVLNDVLNEINNESHVKQVKVRFVQHFGNLSQLISFFSFLCIYSICQLKQMDIWSPHQMVSV